jgi:hypothetical protein
VRERVERGMEASESIIDATFGEFCFETVQGWNFGILEIRNPAQQYSIPCSLLDPSASLLSTR